MTFLLCIGFGAGTARQNVVRLNGLRGDKSQLSLVTQRNNREANARNLSCPMWDMLPHLTKADILLAETCMMTFDEVPKSLRVVHLDNMTKLMNHHVVNQIRREKEQLSIQRYRSVS